MRRPLLPPVLRILVSALALGLVATAQEAPEKKAAPVFKDGMAQRVDAFKGRKNWIQHDLWVETEADCDGNGKKDRVHVDVTRPIQTKTEGLKVPVVYESSPYLCGTANPRNRRIFWDPKHELGAKPPKRTNPPPIRHQSKRPVMWPSLIRTYVPRGFAVVHSAAPGTGLSQGCVTVGGKAEMLAPKAVIDWLNGRAKGFTSPSGTEEVKADWCTGKVGMTGGSYNGTIPLAAACTGVKGLEVIIPVAPNTSYYHYYRANGLVRHPGGYMGEDIDVLYDFINSGNPDLREHCNKLIRDKLLLKNIDRLSGDYNEFWKTRDYWPLVKDIKCAVLLVHGFNDWNVMPRHSTEVYSALKKSGAPTAIYLHQGGHNGTAPFAMMNRWFTHYLYGVKNGVDKDPRSYVVRERARRATAYPDYPHPEAKPVTFHLRKGGGEMGALDLSAGKEQGKETLTDDVAVSGTELARAEDSPHRLLYSTPELKAPVHISGTSRIKVRLSSSAPAANLSVWMVSLPWTRSRRMTDNLITRGWADPQNHKSLTKSEPLKPGKFYDVEFDLQPDDQIIPAGQRIALMIFSSDRAFTLWPEAGTKLTIDLDKTSINIPIVGGADAMKKAMDGEK